MLALYLEKLGNLANDRFDALLLLSKECQMPLDGMKRILAGDRLKLLAGEYGRLEELQEKLTNLGARTSIRIYAEGIDD